LLHLLTLPAAGTEVYTVEKFHFEKEAKVYGKRAIRHDLGDENLANTLGKQGPTSRGGVDEE